MALSFNRQDWPVVMFWLDVDGKVLEVSKQAEALLGYARETLRGADFRSWLEESRIPLFRDSLSTVVARGTPSVCSLSLRQRDDVYVPVLTRLALLEENDGCQILIVAIDDSSRDSYTRELENRAQMLTGFIDASAEAMWCIEYSQPVNLEAGVAEIIRQVFENECHWRMCNSAMARLYSLPEGLDFNRQPVSAYFRRTSENESFVRALIDAKFHIDAAPSLEYRHDGKVFYVENSVRCHLEGRMMHRMWGTVRDITDHQTVRNALAERQRQVTDILSALPDPILVVNLSRHALAVNPAFESTFRWSPEHVLGKNITRIIDLETGRRGLGRWFAPTSSRWNAVVHSGDGSAIDCDVRIAPLASDTERRFVLSLRPITPESRRSVGRYLAKKSAPKSSKRSARFRTKS